MRSKAQQFCAFQIGFRRGFALSYVLRANAMEGEWQSRVLHPCARQCDSGGRYYGKAVLRKGTEQVRGAGQSSYALFVINFHLLYAQVFLLGIHVRGNGPNGFYAPAPMGLRDDFLG